jgi:photosystem II stability/assembly factor-like uncharacterized protein
MDSWLDNGITVGSDGTILRTHDGGTTWTEEWSRTLEPLMDVLITEDGTALVIGGQGTILRSSAGGS